MLADMQQHFRDWLMHASDDASSLLGLNSARGLSAYQNNYRTQLVNCLRASYPTLLSWMGDEVFLEAAIQHIDRHPPSSWTLDVYGADFGDTLRSLYPHNPDLSELAWIEWALSEAFVAADASTVAPEQLANVDWDTARLLLSPSLRQHTRTTNAVAIWSALVDGVEPPEAEMLDAPAGIIVWRREFTSRLIQVDAVEHVALLALRRDDHFSALCDGLVERLGEEQGISRAGSLLAGWIASGIVVGVGDGSN
jgi:hypothetical protein